MGKMKVLIAEDHHVTAKLLSRMLSSSEQLEIVGVVADGEQVLKAIDDKEIDLILLDITLPFIDGIQVMEKLAKMNSDIKVLVLSAHSESWIIRKSIELGASGYLTKSVTINEVIDAVLAINRGESYFNKNSLEALLNDKSSGSTSFVHSILF